MATATELAKYLSKSDLIDVLDLIQTAKSVGTEQQFRRLLHVSSKLMPIEKIHVSVASLNAASTIVGTSRQININYPTIWLSRYRESKLVQIDPVAPRLFSGEHPVIWGDLRKIAKNSKDKSFYGQAAEFGLREGFSFGKRFSNMESGSFFSCEGQEIGAHKRHTAVISFLMQFMHEALSKVHLGLLKDQPLLTYREKQVLNRAKFGKTDSEIAVQVGISRRTVKFHVENAMRKLQANNRTQAIAIALSQNLIDWN
jgi:DNA-binding CsgD family transcriptional regulator